MPPRARGGTGRARGQRGRVGGRGRGGAATSAADTAANEESSSQFTAPLEVQPNSQSNPPANTTPQHQTDERNDSQPDPNFSPATVPTETPAPTPAKPTIERPGPISESAAGESAPRSGTRGGSKFKPRIVRRDASEREKLELAERERQNAISKQSQRAAGRARVWVGRGRGDAMGRRGRGGGEAAAASSGVFSVPSAGFDKRPDFGTVIKKEGGTSRVSELGASSISKSGGGGGEGSGGGSRGVIDDISHLPGTSGLSGAMTRKVQTAEGTFKAPKTYESEFTDPEYPLVPGEASSERIDISRINASSDDEDSDPIEASLRSMGKSKGKGQGRPNSNKGGQKPIRVHREDHVPRKLMKQAVKKDDGEAKPEENPEEAKTPGDANEVMIVGSSPLSRKANAERGFKGIFNDLPSAPIKTEPEASYAFISSASTTVPEAAAGTPVIIPDPAANRSKLTRKSSRRNQLEVILQTEEEIAEIARHKEDLAVLADELGGAHNVSPHKAKDAEGDVAMGAATEATESTQITADKKDGRLYLFQFPPVLPRLYNPATEDDDVIMTVTKENVDLTKEKDANVKMEETEVIIKTEHDVEVPTKSKREAVSEEGYMDRPKKRILIDPYTSTSFLMPHILTTISEPSTVHLHEFISPPSIPLILFFIPLFLLRPPRHGNSILRSQASFSTTSRSLLFPPIPILIHPRRLPALLHNFPSPLLQSTPQARL
ncbi:hypothetical protein B7494_g3053 [Chlorociboria aeruginascens]|nr:hypothetical protein B7494_g3053 [Chlorociboria aeruginascens]